MTNIEKVLGIAIAEEGYLEKSKAAYQADKTVLDRKTDGAGSDNYQKYARDLYDVKYFNGNKQGVEWCAVFVSWCYFTAFGREMALKLQCQPSSGNCGAGCTSASNYYKNKKQFFSSPQPGDQIFFKASNGNGYGHTGIVEAVDSKNVYTIEGNTSAGKSVIPNGGSVCRKSYALNNSKIGGYGRPDWSLVDGKADEPTEVFPYYAIVMADSGKTVNLRKSASSSASILKAVSIGSGVTVNFNYDSTWANVTYKTTTGFMMRQYLAKTDVPIDSEPVDNTLPTPVYDVSRSEFEALMARVAAIEKVLGIAG